MAKRYAGLTQEEFDKRLERLTRKLELMQKVRLGRARLKRVWVKPHAVPAYDVAGHYRYIEEK